MVINLAADQNLLVDLLQLDELWNPAPHPHANSPTAWVHAQGVETWSKQDEIYNSILQNRYTAVKSCHGPGKSFTAANIVAWWMATQKDPFAVTSAPTSHQVRTILWREIRRAKKKFELPGKISQGQVPEWKDPTGEIIAFGRKPADYLDPNEAAAAFQGIHATSLLVVLDEGSGIPDWLATACETLITNESSRMLIIGNPDNPISYFAKAFRPGSGFHKITIKARDTPAFTGEHVSEDLQEKLTSKLWVEEREKRWGKTSPLYISKVEAEFPEITDDTVFTPKLISDAITSDRSRQAVNVQGRYGFDIARLGPDESLVYHNRNGYIRQVARWSKADTMESVGRYRRLAGQPAHAPTAVIDVNGLGAGVFDRLKELHYKVIPFNGGEKPYDPTRYKNRRSESYWEAREAMEAGIIDIEELDEDLQAELLEVKFKVNSTGQIQVEPKEDIQARLGRSPDRADAFVMSLQQQAGPIPLTPTISQENEPHQEEYQENITRPRPSEAQDLTSDVMNLEF